MNSKYIILAFIFVLVLYLYGYHKNTKEVCKNQSTYMINGTTYPCHGENQ